MPAVIELSPTKPVTAAVGGTAVGFAGVIIPAKRGVVSALVIVKDVGAVGTLVVNLSSFGKDVQPLASTIRTDTEPINPGIALTSSKLIKA
jgi:hypothetical protein